MQQLPPRQQLIDQPLKILIIKLAKVRRRS